MTAYQSIKIIAESKYSEKDFLGLKLIEFDHEKHQITRLISTINSFLLSCYCEQLTKKEIFCFSNLICSKKIGQVEIEQLFKRYSLPRNDFFNSELFSLIKKLEQKTGVVKLDFEGYMGLRITINESFLNALLRNEPIILGLNTVNIVNFVFSFRLLRSQISYQNLSSTFLLGQIEQTRQSVAKMLSIDLSKARNLYEIYLLYMLIDHLITNDVNRISVNDIIGSNRLYTPHQHHLLNALNDIFYERNDLRLLFEVENSPSNHIKGIKLSSISLASLI